MPGFLYYKPNVRQTTTLELIKEWGLGYAFTNPPTSTICHENTPNEGIGVIFADESRLGDYQVVMNLDEQEWRPVPKSDCYVGYWKAAPPTPDDLARPQQIPGYRVTLGDHEWIIPLTARFDDSRKMLVTTLPCYLECDQDGNWTEGDVLDLHRHLWDIGQPFRDDVMRRLTLEAEPRDFTNNELCNAAIAYLQANYVVGPGELSLMRGLHKGGEIQGAIMAANDFWTFAQWSAEQKKSNQSSTIDGSNTSSGEAA